MQIVAKMSRGERCSSPPKMDPPLHHLEETSRSAVVEVARGDLTLTGCLASEL
jgi:hypothetical protein